MSSARAAIAVAALVSSGGLVACGSPARSGAPPSAASPASSSPSPPSADLQKPVILTDADIPPLPATPFAPARPIEVVRAVYMFAARHPEVLSHVPCFCGCESRGHRHNDDCFVASRDAKGRPTAWEPHGVG